MRLVQAILLSAAAVSPALAQRAPEIIIPGKPGVPVFINGIDASWGVVEGDFGLDRPGMVTPTVIWPAAAAVVARRSFMLSPRFTLSTRVRSMPARA